MYRKTDDGHYVEQEWGEVKRCFLRAMEEGANFAWPSQPAGQNLGRKFGGDPYEKQTFYGDKPANTAKYVREGFHAENFLHAVEAVPTQKKPRFVYDELEGELDVSMLLAGYDTPYLDIQKRPAKPGLRLDIDFSFQCSVRATTIAEYGEWVAGLINALETSGFDLEVFLDMTGGNVFQGCGTFRNMLKVKHFGEKSNFTEWSALFSPGGFRMLGFLAIPLAVDKVPGKHVCSSSLGRAIGGREWKLDYDEQQSRLRVLANQHSDTQQFPGEKLTAQAFEIGVM